MSDSKFNVSSGYDRNFPNYPQGASVKIVKGSLRGCKGKISGCASNGVYFISRDRCNIEADQIYTPIGLFLPEEFELSD